MKELLILAVMIAAALSADVNVPPEPLPNNLTTTTHEPITNATTTTVTPPTKPSTTATTTTPAPTTTSATTTTTTTTTPTTTTSTVKPTTTAAPTAPTTPKPKPKEPTVLNFTVTDDKNITCIVLKMAIMFEVPYETKTNGTHTTKIIVPKEATAQGECGKEKQVITVSWNPLNNDNIAMEFSKNETTKEFMVSSFVGSIMMENYDFPDAKSNDTIFFVHKKSEFATPLKMSYKCNKKEYLNMTVATNETITVAKFVVSKLQMEAFRNSTTHEFSAAEDCEPFETSGIVPIAVGCSLAALIIIVLIGYLIGRRRSQARGYLSM